MGGTFSGNLKNLLASELIKSSILSQEEALEELQRKHRILLEQYRKNKHSDNLTGEEIKSMLHRCIYHLQSFPRSAVPGRTAPRPSYLLRTFAENQQNHSLHRSW